MDIRHIMRDDHDEALALIEKLEKVAEKEASEETTAMVEKLVTAVKLHSKAEERALYTALEVAKKDLRDFALEGYLEHDALDATLDKLAALEPGEDGEFKAALTVCKEMLEHHGKEEEEGELFPMLEKTFSKDELIALGQTMMAEKENLRGQMDGSIAMDDEEEIDASPAEPKGKSGSKRRAASANGHGRGASR
jgi:hemerythrin-like domain-containing protein